MDDFLWVISLLCQTYMTHKQWRRVRAAVDTNELALRLGYYRVEIEEDASNVILAFQSEGLNMLSIGSLVEEAKRLAAQFESVSWLVTHRAENEVTHRLVRKAKGLDNSNV